MPNATIADTRATPLNAEDMARMRATEQREFFELLRELREAERRRDRYGATLAAGDLHCLALNSESPALRDAAARLIAGHERAIELLSVVSAALEHGVGGRLPCDQIDARAAFFAALDAASPSPDAG